MARSACESSRIVSLFGWLDPPHDWDLASARNYPGTRVLKALRKLQTAAIHAHPGIKRNYLELFRGDLLT